MLEQLTLFDGIALIVILLSALMAFARGFMREIATLGAFLAAAAAAYFAQKMFLAPFRGMMPENAPDWAAPLVLIVIAFVIVYVVVAWIGQRISKNIHGLDGIGMIDHIVGLAFGAVRGGVALVFLALLLDISMDESKLPPMIADSAVYPHLQSAARVANRSGQKMAQDMVDPLSMDTETVQ